MYTASQSANKLSDKSITRQRRQRRFDDGNHRIVRPLGAISETNVVDSNCILSSNRGDLCVFDEYDDDVCVVFVCGMLERILLLVNNVDLACGFKINRRLWYVDCTHRPHRNRQGIYCVLINYI